MKNKRKSIFKTAGLVLLCTVLGACKANPAPAPIPAPKLADELDAAIREASDYLNKQLPRGNKLVILNIQSEFPALSEYIIDELIANTVNDRVFFAVDRQQLDAIRAELDFQMSGEVDDTTAQELGRIAGAQVIISGAVSRIGELYRLRVRALSVGNAQIAGQFNRNIPDGPTVSALARSQATGYGGGGSSDTARNASPTSSERPQPAPASTPKEPEQSTGIFPKIGRWRVTGRDSANWTGSYMAIEEIDTERFSGYFEWYRSGIEYSGREYFRGVFNPDFKSVLIKGYRLVDAKGIGLGTYEAYLSKNGSDFDSGTWGDGRGTWQAKWLEDRRCLSPLHAI